MPVILRIGGFKFFFYSNEGNPLEPAHVHVIKAGNEAKFWLTPSVALASSDGFHARTLKELAAIVEDNQTVFLEAWNDYFS